MNKQLEYVGECNGYNVFRNSQGFLEGYKHSGSKIVDESGNPIGGKAMRIVTETKTVEDFAAFVLPKKKSYSKPPDNQIKMFG